jgi:hypothetical protein
MISALKSDLAHMPHLEVKFYSDLFREQHH